MGKQLLSLELTSKVMQYTAVLTANMLLLLLWLWCHCGFNSWKSATVIRWFQTHGRLITITTIIIVVKSRSRNHLTCNSLGTHRWHSFNRTNGKIGSWLLISIRQGSCKCTCCNAGLVMQSNQHQRRNYMNELYHQIYWRNQFVCHQLTISFPCGQL